MNRRHENAKTADGSLRIEAANFPVKRFAAAASPLFFSLFCVLLFSGCLQSLYPRTRPPQYYRIDYPFQPSLCNRPFPETVRIGPFAASAPYDGEQMILSAPGRKVDLSSHYQWIAPAADMVANDLLRDLSIGKVFESAVPAGSSVPAAYGMSAELYRFDLKKDGASSRALLDLEITLWREKPRRIVFQKHFHYQSPPLASSGPSAFAAAMSDLVARLSLDLRNELCALSKDSSHPAGD
jgi:ABC-type uncharacterized transport system auxiliary subunit